MRNVFLILVLANLGFAAWHTWVAPLTPVLHAADSTLPSITLVSEVPVDLHSAGSVNDAQLQPAAPTPAAQTPKTSTPVAAALPAPPPAPVVVTPQVKETVVAVAPSSGEGAGRCTTIGPFRELSQAATAASTLRMSGFDPQQRVAEGDIWIGYWVYIQAIPSVDEANKILAKVRESGIADSYVIPNSDSGNLVSLGVFSEISGVSRRRDEVRALGFEPHVVDRTRRATVYWVEVMLRADQTIDFESLQPPGRIMRLEQRACGSG
ncbi:MAG: SPOR domain-containing protein [Gammaproteobacteria bacterium]